MDRSARIDLPGIHRICINENHTCYEHSTHNKHNKKPLVCRPPTASPFICLNHNRFQIMCGSSLRPSSSASIRISGNVVSVAMPSDVSGVFSASSTPSHVIIICSNMLPSAGPARGKPMHVAYTLVRRSVSHVARVEYLALISLRQRNQRHKDHLPGFFCAQKFCVEMQPS